MQTSQIILYGCLGVIPLLDLVRVYAQNAFSVGNLQLRNIFHSNLDEIVMNRFATGGKIIIAIFLFLGSLLQITFTVAYHNYGPDLDVILIVEGSFVLTWIQQAILIYYDANQYGRTTNNTKINIFVSLSCLTALSLTLYQKQYDIVCKYTTYTRCSILFLELLVVLASPKDYTMKVAILADYVQMKRKKDLTDQFLLKESDNIQTIQTIIRPQDNDSILTFANDKIKSQKSGSFGDDDNEIKNVQIKTFKESQKYEKRTIIYQIGYIYNRHEKTVYRSFREFLSFHHDLKQEFPTAILPIFPSKKNKVKFLSFEDIVQRQEQLNSFLKGIIIRFNQNIFLRKFLNVQNDTPQYKSTHQYVSPKRITQSRPQAPSSRVNNSYRHQTYASIPETIWEGVGEEEDESIKDDRRTKKRGARSPEKSIDIFHANPQNGDANSPQFREDYKITLSKTCDDYDKDAALLRFVQKDSPSSPHSGNLSTI